LEVILVETESQGASLAARILRRQVLSRSDPVLGLATGATPIPVYAELVRMHREEGLSFRQVTTFNLDEYVGLAPDHPASYRRYMQEHLFEKVDLAPERTHVPDGMALDIPACCARYEEQIRQAGGVDLQLLGLGQDGHIGFNEPSSSLASRTRLKTLTPHTVAANRPGFPTGQDVPRHVLTMGVGTIMEARRCLLVAFGAGKSNAVARMVEGPLTAMVPASILQMHPRATVVVDEAAGQNLRMGRYYRDVYRSKPGWQKE